MDMIPWLESTDAFPSLEFALDEPNGLLCACNDLSPQRILQAYRNGIFPWYSPGDPVLWWSPDPRMVMIPAEFRVSRSLRKTLRHNPYHIRLDSHFRGVIQACARTFRPGQGGTWITTEIEEAYCQLHVLGHAHSVETWRDDTLVGGLYGIAIGKMFYGESMFSHVTDASKIALAHLAHFLDKEGFGLIDCQMNTPHLASLGAREIPRRQFLERLHQLTTMPSSNSRWPENGACKLWN